MEKPTKRPPHGVGHREVVRDAQGKLALKGGRRDRSEVRPRIFARFGETTKRCSFAIDRVRYSGLTPYEDTEAATAFANGALAVATAIHERLGPTVTALVMNDAGGIVRWRSANVPMPSPRRSDPDMSPYAHLRPADIAARLDRKAGPATDD